jgi:molybdopterin molybdotransferase
MVMPAEAPGVDSPRPASGLLPVEEARARILAAIGPIGVERIGLGEALGRVTSEAIVARLSHPPAPVSAMDGYALRAADAAELPARLRRIGTSRAGQRFAGNVEAGTCVRIFTGGVVPAGADTIAIQEDTQADGDTIVIGEVARPGQYIRRAGLDFAAGETCVAAGRTLTPRDIGVIASCGYAEVAVARRPRIAILSTGDELADVGATPAADQIVGSNGVALSAAVRGWGGEPTDLGIARDDVEAIAAAADRAAGHDMLVTTGGVSVGDHDLVQQSLRQRGFTPAFWQIAMRPGKPLMFGKLGALPVIGLPGNPVSALVCALLFLRPAMAAMMGLAEVGPAFETAVLGAAMPANDKREDYVRAELTASVHGRLSVRPFPVQDSAMLLTLVRANVLIRRPAFAPPAAAGEDVEFLRLD